MDMTLRWSVTQTGDQPWLEMWMVSCSTPIIFGMLGPQMSVSIMPTAVGEGEEEKAWARRVVNVDFPTPPLPLRIRILWVIEERRALMRGMSGSGPLGVEAHMAWFGQPAQAEPAPARLD